MIPQPLTTGDLPPFGGSCTGSLEERLRWLAHADDDGTATAIRCIRGYGIRDYYIYWRAIGSDLMIESREESWKTDERR